MSGLFRKLMLVAGIGMIGMAFPGGANAAPMSSYQPAPADHGGSFTLAGNGSQGGYSRDGYTTVIVTNRGQNGYPDHVVKQRVRCWSQYYDGYRQRVAKC